MGIIQGLTEFFPISSSGHLVLLQNLFGLREPQLLVDVTLHSGTLLSLLVFLRRELIELAQSLGRLCWRPKENIGDPKIRLLFFLFLASLPIFFVGYFFHDFIESLFGSLWTVGAALLITGGFLLLTKLAREKQKSNISHPLLIGILQAFALVPGFSRSGLTIGGALLLGWKRKEAAQFSFLLSIPAIVGATLYQLSNIESTPQSWTLVLVGVIVAAVFGFIALTFLVKVIMKGKFSSFSYYCFLVGLIALLVSFL
ncbi:MAG: undecaprenyl-diphosphatase UppP [Candidatus Aminicenantes bacterium]|nr:undecaprenyl-diphosphatase UppP [Candidatus Aminicenantes bacterium]